MQFDNVWIFLYWISRSTLKSKNLLDCKNIFLPNHYQKINTNNTKIFSIFNNYKDEKICKEEESIEILTILGLTENL